MKEATYKTICSVIPLTKNTRKEKAIVIESGSAVARGQGWEWKEIDYKEQEETFGGDGGILYLDYVGGYATE